MAITVSDIYQDAARLMGWRIGTIGTVTVGMTTTTAILGGLVNTTGSPSAYAGWRLIFPDSATGSQETFVISWVDATGTATFTNLTSAPVAGHPYIAVAPTDYTLNEIGLAWSDCQRQSRATYKQIIPITPNFRVQYLEKIDWLRGAGDVDAVYWNISPNALDNEDFAKWWLGPSAVPDSWTLSGAGASVTRITDGLRGPYNARLTSGVGAAAELTQSLPQSLVQWITRRTSPVFTPLRGAAWVSTATANGARVGIRYTESGVTTTTYADYITADGVPHFPELSLTPNANMTDFTLVLQVAAGTHSADFGSAVFMQNTTTAANTFQLRDQGSQFYMEAIPNECVRNWGTVPTVEFDRWPNVPGQIVVYTRRPLAQYTALTDVLDEQYREAYKWGLLAWMLRVTKPTQDRSRLDRIMIDAEREWARFLSNFTSLPVAAPRNQMTVRGA